jgi:hypothetical protein
MIMILAPLVMLLTGASENIVVINAGSNVAYFIGAFIALLILAYLIYSFLKPEKF